MLILFNLTIKTFLPELGKSEKITGMERRTKSAGALFVDFHSATPIIPNFSFQSTFSRQKSITLEPEWAGIIMLKERLPINYLQ